MVVAGRPGFCAAALAAGVLLLTLTGCDPEQAGNPPPGSPPNAQTPRTYVGVRLRNIQFEPSVANGGVSAGVRLEVVVPGAAAAEAGLRENDVVIAAGGTPLIAGTALVQAIQYAGVGGTLPITYLRDDQRQEAVLYPRLRDTGVDAAFRDHISRRIDEEEKMGDNAAAAGTRITALAHYVRALQFMNDSFSAPQADSRINALLVRLAGVQQGAQIRVPPEADRHNRRAIALLQEARGDEDNDRAFQAFNDAVIEAPWIADLWLNTGLVAEKAGVPENAVLYLRRYLLLAPESPDGPAIRQKLAALELMIEDRKPWLPYVGTYTRGDKSYERLSLRGRELTLISVSGSTSVEGNRKDRAGDVIARGTIRGPGGSGKWTRRPTNENEIRCFAAQYDTDLELALELAAGGRQLVFYVINETFLTQSCTITEKQRTAVRRYTAAGAGS